MANQKQGQRQLPPTRAREWALLRFYAMRQALSVAFLILMAIAAFRAGATPFGWGILAIAAGFATFAGAIFYTSLKKFRQRYGSAS